MKVVQLTAHGKPGQFQIVERPDLAAEPGEVVVAVRACGLNHLDLWLEEGTLPITIQLPRVPGSEIAGQILQTGPDVRAWHAGDRVAVQSNLFCGQCEFCERGEESRCLHGQLLGVDRDGGFAEQVLVPERALVRLPDPVSFQTSAALTLAGATAMHMLTDRAQVRPGNWILVAGAASGVGSAAIQIARGLGARVIATASNEAKKALALKLGAEHVVDPGSETWRAQVRKLTGKRGVDVVVEHVGGPFLEQAMNCLARGGTVVTCGATAGREVQLNLWPFFVKEHQLVGSYGRTRRDLIKTLEWAAAGKLQPTIDRVVALSETPAAFTALRNRAVLGKVLVVP
jgi:2-desacetyl-2-hydroxyethyl bacteriochlorophyllide A dehydrogenase